jgi:hypothetical protein
LSILKEEKSLQNPKLYFIEETSNSTYIIEVAAAAGREIRLIMMQTATTPLDDK